MIRKTNQLQIDDSFNTDSAAPVEIGDVLTGAVGKLQGQIGNILSKVDYNASLNTPALSMLPLGGSYVVSTQGRLLNTTIIGAQSGSDAVLLVGDVVELLNGVYRLATPLVTTAQNIDVGIGGTALFTSLKDTMDYLVQRTVEAGVMITVNLLESYTGIESGTVAFAHPQSSQIQVLGVASSNTIIACNGVMGTIGNLAVSYTLASEIVGLAVGDIVIIDQETTYDAQSSLYLGSHCGTWQVSAVSGTEVTVQNIQKMRLTLTPDYFAIARMTKVTKVAEQGDFSNVVQMVVGNVAFFHDLNKYVFYGKNGSILIKGFLGVGSTAASINTTQVTLTEEFDVLSLAYQTLKSAGNTHVVGLRSVFAPNSGKSNAQDSNGFGGAVVSGNINVETLVCGTSTLDSGAGYAVTCKNKFGSYFSKGGELFVFADAGCNSLLNANNTTNGSVYIVTQTAANSNGNGNYTVGGLVYIGTQTSCNNNGSYGNIVGGNGLISVTVQTSCSNNVIGNNYAVGAGTFNIGIQTECTGAQYGNYAAAGSMQITNQDGCSGNILFDNYTLTGNILISGGAEVLAKNSVAVANAGGSIVKVGGINPFTVTDAPVPISYVVSTALNKFNYYSIAAANDVVLTLPAVSTVQLGVEYTIQNGASYTGILVEPAVGDTINNSAGSKLFLANENIVLVATSANVWSILSNNPYEAYNYTRLTPDDFDYAYTYQVCNADQVVDITDMVLFRPYQVQATQEILFSFLNGTLQSYTMCGSPTSQYITSGDTLEFTRESDTVVAVQF